MHASTLQQSSVCRHTANDSRMHLFETVGDVIHVLHACIFTAGKRMNTCFIITSRVASLKLGFDDEHVKHPATGVIK
jgi:hypothetical protein